MMTRTARRSAARSKIEDEALRCEAPSTDSRGKTPTEDNLYQWSKVSSGAERILSPGGRGIFEAIRGIAARALMGMAEQSAYSARAL